MAHVWHVDGLRVGERRPPSARSAWFGLALATLCAASYVVALVLPYYANGFAGATQEELWAHDLTTVWPYGTALGLPIGLAGILAVTVGPFLAAGTLWWSGRTLWVHRGGLATPVRTVLTTTLLVSVGILSWLPTPMAGQLFSWFID
ncbi:hypothetical protein J2X46_004134 [Nocardioides sp. BE266]|uniref:hypothetical protein n=1 Tax=Nocardioides sp. BE266 TaxID=2817725 RepID=UPI0028645AD3|nr:hypothetical protein [Nocardioides sp. BE266]MDR7255132.1 hypothetical protein [Nocardioides sp. BE266]